MQTFSALNVRSHQRRQFISSAFAYRDNNVLKLTGARTFEFVSLCVPQRGLVPGRGLVDDLRDAPERERRQEERVGTSPAALV